MNVQEFRVGNYIKDTFDIKNIKIRKLDLEDFSVMLNFQNSNNHPNTYNPIPLTEGILLKCGFIKRTPSGFYFDLERISINVPDFEYKNIRIDAKVRYLHQLQNLYWCLVGEELEINL